VKRREAMAAMSAAFIPSPKLGPYDDPAFLRHAAITLAHTRREHGGLNALSVASRHYQHIQAIIKGDDRKLQAAASHLARQIAWTLHDAGRFDAAENAGVWLVISHFAPVILNRMHFLIISLEITQRWRGEVIEA
jgi:hypothetical protein